MRAPVSPALPVESFNPASGLGNPHLQTLWGPLWRTKPVVEHQRERLWLDDGDFLDLDWHGAPSACQPLVLLLHGLTGSSGSHYIVGQQCALAAQGWASVALNWRGCSGEPNLLARSYHSGASVDLAAAVAHLRARFPLAPLYAVGYSLGGNMLACLLAKEGESVPLDAAVIVSAPFMLEQCSYHMDKGYSRVYQRYLLNLLKANAARKLKAYPDTLPVSLRQLKKVRRIREFDDLITAKIHGFADAIDYYRQCSAMPLLSKITQPTLIIHAKDDPFMDHHSIPAQEFLPDNVHYQLTEHGGHVGFIGGTLRRPKMWLEARIPDWLTPYLDGAT